MNCPDCGTDIPRGWVRCAECGHMLEGAEWRGMIEREQSSSTLQLRSVYGSMDFILAFAAIIFICSGIMYSIAKYNTSNDFAKHKIEVAFEIEPRISDGQVQILGTTNLPEGTDLVIVLSNSDYRSESKIKVSNGSFTSKRFGIDGKPLGIGAYSVEISMSSALMQDEDIQKRIGKHGEMLTGPYVSKKSGNLIKYEKSIEIN